MAVDALCLGAQKYVLLVGRHDVAVNARDFHLALGVVGIKEDTCLLAGLEGTYHNSLSVHQLAVTLAVGQGIYTIYAMGIKLAAGDGLEGKGTVLCHAGCGHERREKYGQYEQNLLYHCQIF